MFKENKSFWLYFVGIIFLFFALLYFAKGYFSGNPLDSPIESPNGAVTASGIVPTKAPDKPPGFTIDVSKDYQAVLKTNKGEITLDLLEKNAPNTVNNFVYLATSNFFNNTKFHRLIPGLLLQGGSPNTRNSDPKDDATGGPDYVIADEINWDSLDYSEFLRQQLIKEGYQSALKVASVNMDKYSVAMANPGPNLNGSQFFIVLADKSSSSVALLEGRYTVFAQVTGGKDVVDALAKIPVDDPNSNSPRPKEDIIINSVEIIVK